MTLIDLAGRLRALHRVSAEPFIARVTRDAEVAADDRAVAALLLPSEQSSPSAGFAAYLCTDGAHARAEPNTFVIPRELRYLAEGDVIRIDPNRRSLRVLYRKMSRSNSFLVTERCDNFCVMCSQPPRPGDDAWLVDELLRVIPLVDRSTESIGITGGEPGLLGPRLLELLSSIRAHLPRTAVHVLTNGRAFADLEFARGVAAIGLDDLMLGIPLYSDLPEDHDYVVQARGAFNETVLGVLNLKRARVRVELRFVIHKETVRRLPEFAEFVARNLLFVDQVALMGLELTGFAKTNLDALWIDPLDYGEVLVRAVETLHAARVPVSIYNHQLCVLPGVLHRFARQSISDWKNWYPRECDGCSVRTDCGGFFASSTLRRSRGIAPVAEKVSTS